MDLCSIKHTLNYQTTLHNSNIETLQTIPPRFGTNYFKAGAAPRFTSNAIHERNLLLLTQS